MVCVLQALSLISFTWSILKYLVSHYLCNWIPIDVRISMKPQWSVWTYFHRGSLCFKSKVIPFIILDCKFNCHKRCFERAPRNCLGEISLQEYGKDWLSDFNTVNIASIVSIAIAMEQSLVLK